MTRKADTYRFTNTEMHRAYDQLRHLLRNEWEFPDACFKAASREGVPYEALADFYDEMQASSL
jgi:hypothetical protein